PSGVPGQSGTGVEINTGAWGSFFSDGRGGVDYPHPLRGMNIQNTAPAFTNANNNSGTPWPSGQTNTLSVSTSGNPPATIPKARTPALPSWMSFSATSGSGAATFTSTSSAVAGTYGPFALTASNGISPDATQNLTITVTNPAAIVLSCSLIRPTDGSSFLTTDTVNLEATAVPSTGHTVSKVEFFQKTTGAYASLGIGTFDSASSSYKTTWGTPAAGNYTVKATVTE